ncbi:hypothetical protein E4U46_007330 [Claviceps purpurea]|nr:hypothetical protein E4U46_007330 [Claviceps purpurea]
MSLVSSYLSPAKSGYPEQSECIPNEVATSKSSDRDHERPGPSHQERGMSRISRRTPDEPSRRVMLPIGD